MEYLSNVIDTRYEQWADNNSIVLITAPTGSGKTYFSMEVLLDECIRRDGKAAYICNRSILVSQVHDAKMKAQLQRCMRHPRMKLFTYQHLEQDEFYIGYDLQYLSECTFIILDEAARYNFDPAFAGSSEKSLRHIMKLAGKVCLIFMTATPKRFRRLLQSCLDEVNEKRASEYEERKAYFYNMKFDDCFDEVCGKKADRDSFSNYVKTSLAIDEGWGCYEYEIDKPQLLEIKEVGMDTDYSYLHLHFYDGGPAEIVRLIEESPLREKWLIFSNSKKKNKDMKKRLQREMDKKGIKRKAKVISAEYRKDRKMKKSVEKIIADEKLPANVVFSTVAMDVGITIKDKNLKNILIADGFFEDELIQLVGRRRVRDGEEINLYVNRCSAWTFKRMMNRYFSDYKEMFPAYDSYTQSVEGIIYARRIKWSLVDAYTYTAHGDVVTSNLGLYVLSENYNEAKRLYELLEKDPNAYAKDVAGYFSVPYRDDMILELRDTEAVRKRIISLLNEAKGIFVRNDNPIIKTIIEEAGEDGKSVRKVNGILNNLEIGDRFDSLSIDRSTVYYLKSEGFPVKISSKFNTEKDIESWLEANPEMDIKAVFRGLFNSEISKVFSDCNDKEETIFLTSCLDKQPGFKDKGYFKVEKDIVKYLLK